MYNRAIRLAMVNFEKGISDKLADKLLQDDVGQRVFRVNGMQSLE